MASKLGRRFSGFGRFMTRGVRGKNNRPLIRDSVPLLLEGLEDRMAPAIYNVTGVADGAGMITQTGPNTFNASTLRAAVNAANASVGIADTINVPAGTYSLTVLPSELDVTDNLTILGAGPASTVIEANFTGRVFRVFNTVATLNGLTIADGQALKGDAPVGGANDAFGGGIFNQGTLTLTNDVVGTNLAQGAAVNGTGTNFSGGVGAGGGIYNDGGTLVITNSTIQGNNALGGAATTATPVPGTPTGGAGLGGGIFNDNSSGTGSLTLTNCMVSGNVATGGAGTNGYLTSGSGGKAYGGGLYDNHGTMTITGTTFSGNTVSGGNGTGNGATGGQGGGGGLFTINGLMAGVQSSSFSGNQADGGSATETTGNTSALYGGTGSGGGVLCVKSSLTISNSTFSNNLATGNSVTGPGSVQGGRANGGGIDNLQGTLVVQNSMISMNQATGGLASGKGTPSAGSGGGGGIYNNNVGGGGSLTLTGSTLSGNQAVGGAEVFKNTGSPYGAYAYGGGLDDQSGKTTVTATMFTGNMATGGILTGNYGGHGGAGEGGGLFTSSSVIAIQQSTFSGNQALGGGASYTTINESGVYGGSAGGGAIFTRSDLSISKSTITGNTALGGSVGGGGIITGGTGKGGGLYNSFGTLHIQDSTISANQAFGGTATGSGKPFGGNAYGGGIYNISNLDGGGPVTLTGSTLSGNFAVGGTGTQTNFNTGYGGHAGGGGLSNQSGGGTITTTTFSANQATGGSGIGDYGGNGGPAKGGGFQTINGNMTIQQSTFSGNVATGGSASYTISPNYKVASGTGYGGGISSYGANPSISESTISGNTAAGGNGNGYGGAAYGGGVHGNSGSSGRQFMMTNCTVAFNQANGGTGGTSNLNGQGSGGGVFAEGGSARAMVESNIIAKNTSSGLLGSQAPDVGGNFTSNGFNLIGIADLFSNGFTNGVKSDQVGGAANGPIDPLLAALANNGGPTQTNALKQGSPAIDAGANPNSLANDQRGPGFARTVGAATDIGAFEAQITGLSGFVFNDANDNGVFDTGETGIANVTVTLTGNDQLGNAVNLTTTTDNTGFFSFPGLLPSDPAGYTLTETQPAGLLPGQASVPAGQSGTVQGSTVISAIVLNFGFSEQNYDFAQLSPASLAGFVFNDANDSGVFNAGSGIGSVTVTLTGTDDQSNPVNLSTQTLATGAYSFVSLRPGTYTITVTQPAGFLPGTDTQGTPGGGTIGVDQISNITLIPGVNGANNNFAQLVPATLAGFVFNDANDNGVFNAGESGIGAVTVTLTGTDDHANPVNLVTQTLATGAYSFANLRPGAYTITETPPAGFLNGTDTQGTPGNGTVGANQFANITLVAGVNGANNDFAELVPAGLAGFVYNDANDNGVFNEGESGIGGVTLTLTGTDDHANPVNLITQTLATGAYSFANLRPGTYTITEAPPAGFLNGTDTQGTPGNGTIGVDTISNITLVAGVNGANNDFAELAPASLAGFVYNDANDNGVFNEGESGIGGVTVTLTGTDDHNNPVNLSTQTVAGGAYNFANLRPGTYTITETPPAGFLNGIDTQGIPGNGTTGVDKFSNIALTSGTVGANNNFAQVAPSSLSGFVFNDLNDNGIFEENESGIGNVPVALTGFDQNSNPVNLMTQTNAGGAYAFNNLFPGTYTITETPPAGFLQGFPFSNQFSNISLNSGGTVFANNNFAELAPASLAGFVFIDANKNGKFDPGDKGFVNATVTLTGSDDREVNVNLTMQTDAGGAYGFSNLRPGVYTITLTPPHGILPERRQYSGHTRQRHSRGQFVQQHQTATGSSGRQQ